MGSNTVLERRLGARFTHCTNMLLETCFWVANGSLEEFLE